MPCSAVSDCDGSASGRRLRAVDWGDLHLTSARGHDVHLATTTAAVHRLDAHGLAELLTRLDLTSAAEVVTDGRTPAGPPAQSHGPTPPSAGASCWRSNRPTQRE